MQVELTDEELKIIAEALYHFHFGCGDDDYLTLSSTEMEDQGPKAWQLRNKILLIGKIATDH